jgi:hypothetical protein
MNEVVEPKEEEEEEEEVDRREECSWAFNLTVGRLEDSE